MKIIQLCRINKEFAPAHSYMADGKRIGQRQYKTLEALSQHTDCIQTVHHGESYHHYKTIRIPQAIAELSAPSFP